MSYDAQDPDFQYLAVDKKALLKKQAEAGDTKKMCFIPDEKEGWAKGEIQSTKGDDVVVLCDKGGVSIQF